MWNVWRLSSVECTQTHSQWHGLHVKQTQTQWNDNETTETVPESTFANLSHKMFKSLFQIQTMCDVYVTSQECKEERIFRAGLISWVTPINVVCVENVTKNFVQLHELHPWMGDQLLHCSYVNSFIVIYLTLKRQTWERWNHHKNKSSEILPSI